MKEHWKKQRPAATIVKAGQAERFAQADHRRHANFQKALIV